MHSITRQLLKNVSLLLALTVSLPAIAESCKTPQYRQGQMFGGPLVGYTVNISIDGTRFTLADLVCLGERLERDYGRQSSIGVFIFDDYSAASVWTVAIGSEDPVITKHIHAYYFQEPTENRKYISLIPDMLDGGISSTLDTRIDLPLKGAIPPCKVQIENRCLLSMEHRWYPGKKTGTVILSGTIARNGRITGLKDDTNGSNRDLIADATKTIKTWRFERSRKKTPFQIRFLYRVVADLPQHTYQGLTEFSLPNEVRIAVQPPDRTTPEAKH